MSYLALARSVPPDYPDGHHCESVAGDAEIAWRADVMRQQLPTYPRPLPLLLARPDVPYRTGACISCGDTVKATRCEPCRVAVERVLATWTRHPPGSHVAPISN